MKRLSGKTDHATCIWELFKGFETLLTDHEFYFRKDLDESSRRTITNSNLQTARRVILWSNTDLVPGSRISEFRDFFVSSAQATPGGHANRRQFQYTCACLFDSVLCLIPACLESAYAHSGMRAVVTLSARLFLTQFHVFYEYLLIQSSKIGTFGTNGRWRFDTRGQCLSKRTSRPAMIGVIDLLLMW